MGIGTGKNISYYENYDFVAIDTSRKMIEYAKRRKERMARRVELVIADVEMIPFKDGTFDGVISTYVFCSVENPAAGLKEIYRILKSNGSKNFCPIKPIRSMMARLFRCYNNCSKTNS